MPDYDLTRLGSRAFEQMVVALSRRVLGPGVQAFGDGPDGGREATFEGTIRWSATSSGLASTIEDWTGFTVLQAKFQVKPKSKPQADGLWLQEEIRKEIDGWADAAARNSRTRLPDYLIFVSNVELSSSARTGGIDRLNAYVTGRLADVARSGVGLTVKGFVIWHADQLRSMLDADEDVRHAFPSLLSVADVLSMLEPRTTGPGLPATEQPVPGGPPGPLTRSIDRITDPFELEVHRAIAPSADEIVPALPAYVERAHDLVLAEVAARAAAGSSSLAVLVGDSSTGKTRSCWELIHGLPPGWRLWHPISPSPAEAGRGMASAAGRGRAPVGAGPRRRAPRVPRDGGEDRASPAVRDPTGRPHRHAMVTAGSGPGGSRLTQPPRASHSRCFRGLRLHVLCTLHGLPVAFALTGAIWHNDHTGQPVMRSLTAYDH
ncbi:hypothetical protein [Kitasatospora sp. NPDC005856]|uniref:hypothetical protein n=1 Tax=Kitasatospora sp. NPDC005856 TaxID=3154566 RepID=UPI0033CADA42